MSTLFVNRYSAACSCGASVPDWQDAVYCNSYKTSYLGDQTPCWEKFTKISCNYHIDKRGAEMLINTRPDLQWVGSKPSNDWKSEFNV